MFSIDPPDHNFFKDIHFFLHEKLPFFSLGHHTGSIKEDAVYSGGSCDVLSRLIGARGRDVLYVGDHIFGDVLKSKKLRGI